MDDVFYFFIMMTAIAMIFIIGFTLMHEQTHQVIYMEAGIPSHVTYNLTGGVTYADTNEPIPNWVTAQQMQAESFGYQIVMPTIAIIFTMFICTLFIILSIRYNVNELDG